MCPLALPAPLHQRHLKDRRPVGRCDPYSAHTATHINIGLIQSCVCTLNSSHARSTAACAASRSMVRRSVGWCVQGRLLCLLVWQSHSWLLLRRCFVRSCCNSNERRGTTGYASTRRRRLRCHPTCGAAGTVQFSPKSSSACWPPQSCESQCPGVRACSAYISSP